MSRAQAKRNSLLLIDSLEQFGGRTWIDLIQILGDEIIKTLLEIRVLARATRRSAAIFEFVSPNRHSKPRWVAMYNTNTARYSRLLLAQRKVDESQADDPT